MMIRHFGFRATRRSVLSQFDEYESTFLYLAKACEAYRSLVSWISSGSSLVELDDYWSSPFLRPVRKASKHIKITLFLSLFWLLGLVILIIGIYAEAERQRHKTLGGIFLAPAVILLLLGITMFSVSFIGMVGSLRDNKIFLQVFFWVLGVIFVVQVILILLEFVFENKMLPLFQTTVQNGIPHYYDDLDFKNILDYVQKKFSCCGGDDYKDWMHNLYHDCKGKGALACGVPHTCCVKSKVEGVDNTLCGFKTLDKERLEVIDLIHVRGCVHAVSLWFRDNVGVTVGLLFGLLLPQLFGLVLSWMYLTKLRDLARDMVDFKFRQLHDIRFKDLDLTGAGWCLCLPREEGYLPVLSDDDDGGNSDNEDGIANSTSQQLEEKNEDIAVLLSTETKENTSVGEDVVG
ncbi:tetraspanin-15-like [Protopterus annectens]|uniref:tetraspanin-15-like n=1 Tax=Protopterus annectens TaxID=7888 RepID=UPI001CFBC7A1|nr:tetraspanin-15-like [Protopterus annectens]